MPTKVDVWPAGGGKMGERIRTHDWAATPLGPLAEWPQSLRTAVDIMLASPGPVSILWGAERTQLYNDAYIPIAADRHPVILGRSAAANWVDAYADFLGPLLDRVYAGEAVVLNDQVVPLCTASGEGVDERVFTATFSPIRDETGAVAGAFHPLVETTERVRADATHRESEERHAFLLRLSDALRAQTDEAGIGRVCTQLLAEHMRIDRSYLSRFWPDEDRASIGSEYRRPDLTPITGEFRPSDFPNTIRHLETEPLVIRDTASDPNLSDRDKAALLAGDLAALIAVPLREGDWKVVWCLTVATTSPRNWTRNDLVLLEEVAERVWVAIERARTEAARHESEERFRAIAQTIEDVFYMTNIEQDVLEYISPSYERVWARSAAELLTDVRSFVGTIHPEDHPKYFDNKARQMRGESVADEYRILRPDGEMRWIYDRSFPVPGAVGTRAAGIMSDITERKRTEERLRESEERYRLAIEAYQGGVSEYFPQTEEVWGSSTYSQLFGEAPAEGPRRLDHFYARIHPDDLERTRQAVASLLAGQKKLLDVEYRARHTRGHWIHLWTRAVALRAEAGEASRIIATTVDVSKRKRAEAALRESEERLRLALDVGRLATWDWDLVTGVIRWNDEHYRLLGYEVGEISPSYEAWIGRIHPDDREATVAALARAREERAAYVKEFRYLLPDGSTRWCAARGRFFYARRGKPVRMIGVTEDITERVQAEEYQRLLLSELQHRVRNTLAVVRSIARRTAASSETIEDYTAHFDGRLNAFARTQAAVTRDPSGGVDLETLLAEELMAHGAREGGQVHLDGPSVRLQPKAAEMLALAVHELTTNAVKYGALSTPVGRLDIGWAIDGDGDDRRLTLRWAEDLAGRPVMPPRRRGFGFEMLERTLAYDLGAETHLDFTETGLRCIIGLPLDSRVGHADI